MHQTTCGKPVVAWNITTEVRSGSINDGQELNGTSQSRNQKSKQGAEFRVPNIVHYVWFADEKVDFRFDRALSILSASKYIKPEAIYFHTNLPPTGEYFEMVQRIPQFKVNCFIYIFKFCWKGIMLKSQQVSNTPSFHTKLFVRNNLLLLPIASVEYLNTGF